MTQADLEKEEDRISYAMGHDIGTRLKQQDYTFNPDVLAEGIKDGLLTDESLLTPEELREAMLAYQNRQQEERAGEMKAVADSNKQEGDAFLEENKTKDGVVVLPSGLQYQILREGTGPQPQLTDQVSTHYVGAFLDGTEFNNSYSEGKPAIFPVNRVIPGWTEALQLMKVGAKWKLWIPPDLGYGEAGRGEMIPPNSTLVFEVELLSIVK
jgi:FKBP-type peptidyl-prolyl cis-trans isomerase